MPVKRRHIGGGVTSINIKLSVGFDRRGSDMDYMVMGYDAFEEEDAEIDFTLALPSPQNPGSAFCLDNIVGLATEPLPQQNVATNQSHLYCDVEGISQGSSPRLMTRPVIHPRQDHQSLSFEI